MRRAKRDNLRMIAESRRLAARVSNSSYRVWRIAVSKSYSDAVINRFPVWKSCSLVCIRTHGANFDPCATHRSDDIFFHIPCNWRTWNQELASDQSVEEKKVLTVRSPPDRSSFEQTPILANSFSGYVVRQLSVNSIRNCNSRCGHSRFIPKNNGIASNVIEALDAVSIPTGETSSEDKFKNHDKRNLLPVLVAHVCLISGNCA